MPKRTNPENADQMPRGRAATKKRKENLAAGIPSSLPWTLDNNAKTWLLIAELGKMENYKVLFGKKDKKEVCDSFFSGRILS